jgi:hypothetical protein
MVPASVRFAVPLLVALLGSAVIAEDLRAERARLDREAREAHGRKDYPGFLEWSRKLVALTPGSVGALYNLACAQALTGGGDQAIATLDRIARMGVILDAAKDPDFASLRGSPAFGTVLGKMAALLAPVGRSRVAFTLPERDLVTEGIGWDPKSGDFFVSSVHRRKVLRVSRDGRVADFVKEGR